MSDIYANEIVEELNEINQALQGETVSDSGVHANPIASALAKIKTNVNGGGSSGGGLPSFGTGDEGKALTVEQKTETVIIVPEQTVNPTASGDYWISDLSNVTATPADFSDGQEAKITFSTPNYNWIEYANYVKTDEEEYFSTTNSNPILIEYNPKGSVWVIRFPDEYPDGITLKMTSTIGLQEYEPIWGNGGAFVFEINGTPQDPVFSHTPEEIIAAAKANCAIYAQITLANSPEKIPLKIVLRDAGSVYLSALALISASASMQGTTGLIFANIGISVVEGDVPYLTIDRYLVPASDYNG